MAQPSAEELFTQLDQPSGEGHLYSTADLGADKRARVGKSSRGTPAFLLAATDPRLAPIHLRNLSAVFNAPCRLMVDGGERDELLTVVECLSTDREVQALFLRGLGPVVELVARTAVPGDVRKAVESLAELFRALNRPRTRSVLGLWGELLVLAHASNPARMARGWHVEFDERFDFAEERLRIEVKTTRSPRREHEVSLEQIRSDGIEILLVSIQTGESAGGTSVGQLMNELLSRLAGCPGEQLLVMEGVAGALGSEWSTALDVAFDRQRARSSMSFYSADEVPAVSTPIPSQVRDVRFTVDLSSTASVSLAEVGARGGLWGALIPKR
jgi:hypothetical protein